ncbi:MAG: IS66 family transposase [Bacteroidetes bacterium]|nr:MAG: IS66 family transposase [Bacteroidota bacterium]
MSIFTHMESEKTVTISNEQYQKFLKQESEIEWLKHQLSELQRMIFGAKSERFIAPDPSQLNLFDFPATATPEKQTEEITYTRTKPEKEDKKQPLRAELPAHLLRKVEVIEPENLPEGAKKIGEAITEVLEYEPASMYVRQIVRPKYIVESTDESTRIEIARLPSMPIPKGNAGASVLAHILVSKFVDHLPYYRQSKIFKRQNLHIPDSTIGSWANTAIGNWLSPLWEALKSRLLKSHYLMADETPIPVLSEDKPGATHRGYHWVYYDPVNLLVLFDYRQTRGREGPRSLLKDFTGYLQSDGYNAYYELGPPGKITHLACWAHARRKFEHALNNDPSRAEKMLAWIRKLYDIERQAKENALSPEQIKELRQIASVPVLTEIEEWLISQKPVVLPKSAIGVAVNYTLGLWVRLKKYVDDGHLQIDNNLVENSIRPVALGRKNYLFAGSHDAAQRAAVVYSLLATCKLQNIEPYAYLKNLLETIPDYQINKLANLLPGR